MITPVTDDTSATNAAPPSPQQDAGVPARQAAPAPPPQPGSLWKNMLVGAMQGIAGAKGATSFGGGVAGGAANVIAQKQQAFENQQTQQQNTSINNFRDVQSAHLVAQTAAEAATLQHMPEEYQQQRDDHAQKMAETNQKNGWATYTPISLKDGQAAMTYLNSQPGGASMPPGTITGATVAYVPSANSDAGSAFEQYKILGPAFGMAALDRGSFLRMKPEQQAQQVRMLTNIQNGRKMDGSTYKANELPQAISTMTDLAAKAKAAGNDAAAQAVSSTLGELQNQLNASDKHGDAQADKKFVHDKELANIRGASIGGNRATDWVDSDGVMHKGLVKDMPAGAAPVAGSQKAAAQTANFDDMQSASGNLRSAISKMEPLDPKAIALLQTAVRDGHGITGAEIKSAGINTLSEPQKDFIVWTSQLNERALALRQVAGMGQGSDSLRAAILATLPGAGSGDKTMMLKQLNAFDNQVHVLRSGVLKRPGQQSAPASAPAQTAPAAAPAAPAQAGGQFSHISASGKFGWDGTKWVPIQGGK